MILFVVKRRDEAFAVHNIKIMFKPVTAIASSLQALNLFNTNDIFGDFSKLM